MKRNDLFVGVCDGFAETGMTLEKVEFMLHFLIIRSKIFWFIKIESLSSA